MIRESGDRPQTPSKQGYYYLISGLVFGVILGLIFSLGFAPLRYTDADVAMLDESSKKEYRILVAMTYIAENDLGRAKERLHLLEGDNDMIDLQTQAAQMKGDNGLTVEWQAMEQLLFDLSNGSIGNPVDVEPESEDETETVEEEGILLPDAMPTEAVAMAEEEQNSPAEKEGSLESTAVPKETIPPKPTSTTAAAINKPFQLEERLIFCDQTQPQLLQVVVVDEEGISLPGVPIHISWAGGSETFFTGLYGEVDDGYADFGMQEGVAYRIQVGKSDTFVDNLSPKECQAEDGSAFLGGWWLAFRP